MNTKNEKILIKALNNILKRVPEGDEYDPGQFVMDVEEIAGRALHDIKKNEKAEQFQSQQPPIDIHVTGIVQQPKKQPEQPDDIEKLYINCASCGALVPEDTFTGSYQPEVNPIKNDEEELQTIVKAGEMYAGAKLRNSRF